MVDKYSKYIGYLSDRVVDLSNLIGLDQQDKSHICTLFSYLHSGRECRYEIPKSAGNIKCEQDEIDIARKLC